MPPSLRARGITIRIRLTARIAGVFRAEQSLEEPTALFLALGSRRTSVACAARVCRRYDYWRLCRFFRRHAGDRPIVHGRGFLEDWLQNLDLLRRGLIRDLSVGTGGWPSVRTRRSGPHAKYQHCKKSGLANGRTHNPSLGRIHWQTGAWNITDLIGQNARCGKDGMDRKHRELLKSGRVVTDLPEMPDCPISSRL